MNQKNTSDVHDFLTMCMEQDSQPACASVQAAKCHIRNLIRLGNRSMTAEDYQSFTEYSYSLCALTQDNS